MSGRVYFGTQVEFLASVQGKVRIFSSVADPDRFDPDPAFHFDTDPDPAFHFDKGPGSDRLIRIRILTVSKR
jgi:hypothetical protein